MWRTNGTEAGTVLVKDIGSNPYGSDPQSFTAVGDTVYFLATGRLWRSDGTGAGTVPVPDVSTGRYDRPYYLTASGNELYFGNDDGVHDDEVWVSDGTESGTHLTRDIYRRVDWEVSARAQSNPRNTAAWVSASFDSPGRVSVAPALSGGIRRVGQRINGTGTIEFTLVLELTRAAKRTLRRTGRVTIGAKFTFASCTGATTSSTRSYTLRKR